MHKHRFFMPLLAIPLSALSLSSSFADVVSATVFVNQGSPLFQTQSNSPTPLVFSKTASLSNANVSASFGLVSLSLDSTPTPTIFSISAIASGNWTESFTINAASGPQGGAGTANFTFSLEGTITGAEGAPGHTVQYSASAPQGNTLASGTYDKDGFFGVLPSQSTTFTVPFAFNYGVPFDVSGSLSVNADTYGFTSYAHASLSLRETGFTVAGGNYGSTSATGTGRGATFLTNADYDGLTLANNVGHHSTATVLDGTAGANRDVAMNFSAAPVTATPLFSDVVGFGGTITDKFVMQVSYDSTAAQAQSVTEANLVLEWYNPLTSTWVNSVYGNSDGGATQQHFLGAYDSNTEFVLGDYGVDTTNHVVWAVIDHNSDFAVTQAAPEPGSATLLVLGLAALAARRRRL